MVIQLQKGQALSLKKPDGSGLTRVMLGLGWDEVQTSPAPKRGFLNSIFGSGSEESKDIDLDASALLFDRNGRTEDIIFYGKLVSSNGSIEHTGDNLTGEGEGDDEQIIVDLTRIPSTVESIVFTITSYSGQNFNQIQNVFARVVDLSSGTEFVRYNLAESDAKTANVIAKLKRDENGWNFVALGNFGNGKTPKDVIDLARTLL